MNIHEYQAKQLLAKYGVNVPFESPPSRLRKCGRRRKKSPPAAAPRSSSNPRSMRRTRKGTFKSGFQGGVKVAAAVDEAVGFAEKMLGQVLVTKQTGHDGRLVQTLLLAAGAKIKKEFYLAVLLNRELPARSSWPAPRAAWTLRKSPPRIPKRFSRSRLIPPSASCRIRRAKIAAALGLKGDLFNAGVKLITGVYNTWWECDASMVELNPSPSWSLPTARKR